MFDLKWIRESPEAFDTGLTRRGLEPASARVLDLDARRRQAQTELQELQTARNTASKAIGDAGHRKPCGTPSESLGKPPFRSGRRTAGGRIGGGVGKP